MVGPGRFRMGFSKAILKCRPVLMMMLLARWALFGYAGEPYCKRCSELFRDHLLREVSNSAQCTRESPCDDCCQILEHCPAERDGIWAKYAARQAKLSAKAELNARKKAALAGGSDDASLLPKDLPTTTKKRKSASDDAKARSDPGGVGKRESKLSKKKRLAAGVASLLVVVAVSVKIFGHR